VKINSFLPQVGKDLMYDVLCLILVMGIFGRKRNQRKEILPENLLEGRLIQAVS
jgi:hypothetical protein